MVFHDTSGVVIVLNNRNASYSSSCGSNSPQDLRSVLFVVVLVVFHFKQQKRAKMWLLERQILA